MPSATLAQPDVTLALDGEGIIKEATLSNAISGESVQPWLGRRWQDTVGDDGGHKIRLIVQDARISGISAFRSVLQRFPSGLELPIEYTTVRVDGKRGGLVAIGKHLQAVSELQMRLIANQQAREQEYWKLREVETRYRLLFDASSEAVMLVRAENFRVVEANPAAVRMLGVAAGWVFEPEMSAEDRDVFHAMLARVREQGRMPGVVVHLGGEHRAWVARASVVSSEPGLLFLLHLAPVGQSVGEAGSVVAHAVDDDRRAESSRGGVVVLDALIERMPDGFAVVDAEGVILRANPAFADLVQVGGAGVALGQRIGRWLSRPGSDITVLLAAVQRHRVVRLLSTWVSGELGAETEVEVSAASNSDVRPNCFGLLLRDVGRRLHRPAGADQLAEVLRAAADQLGRTPLLRVVRDTADAVERYYIRTALDMADGNRTAAAELLGLSRQSLHTKLNRHGFEGTGAEPVPGAG
jgi:transcriptional regulator PpsR